MRLLVCVLVLLGVVLPGCGKDTPGVVVGDLADPWAPTTVPWDPACADCEELRRDEFGHVGEVALVWNPAVDDPVAQWGDCLHSFVTCMDAGGEVRACVTSAECPAACRVEFARQAADIDGEAALLDTFEGVFIADGAPCRPPPAAPGPPSDGTGAEVTP